MGPLINGSAAILWASPPADVNAADAALPLMAYFAHNGLIYMRSGLSDDSNYLQFRSDPVGVGVSHAHSDRGAFTFAGLGRMWAVPPGFSAALDIDQNLVLIDGKGEGYPPEPGK